MIFTDDKDPGIHLALCNLCAMEYLTIRTESVAVVLEFIGHGSAPRRPHVEWLFASDEDVSWQMEPSTQLPHLRQSELPLSRQKHGNCAL